MIKIGHALNVPVPACIYWQYCDESSVVTMYHYTIILIVLVVIPHTHNTGPLPMQ